MWTDKAFWADSSWRAFRSFLHALAGGLVMTNTTSAFSAPWWGLIGAGLVAAVLSLAQSVDRGRAVVSTEKTIEHEQFLAQQPVVESAGVVPMGLHSPVSVGCGDDLR